MLCVHLMPTDQVVILLSLRGLRSVVAMHFIATCFSWVTAQKCSQSIRARTAVQHLKFNSSGHPTIPTCRFMVPYINLPGPHPPLSSSPPRHIYLYLYYARPTIPHTIAPKTDASGPSTAGRTENGPARLPQQWCSFPHNPVGRRRAMDESRENPDVLIGFRAKR